MELGNNVFSNKTKKKHYNKNYHGAKQCFVNPFDAMYHRWYTWHRSSSFILSPVCTTGSTQKHVSVVSLDRTGNLYKFLLKIALPGATAKKTSGVEWVIGR